MSTVIYSLESLIERVPGVWVSHDQIEKNERQFVSQMLRSVMGNVYAVMWLTQACSWNFRGLPYEASQNFLIRLVRDFSTQIDKLAARVRFLDDAVPVTYSEMVRCSQIDIPPKLETNKDILRTLVDANATAALTIRNRLEACQKASQDEVSFKLVSETLLKHQDAARLMGERLAEVIHRENEATRVFELKSSDHTDHLTNHLNKSAPRKGCQFREVWN